MRHQIDLGDLEFFKQRYGNVTKWVPCPRDPKTGKINPQVTQVYLGGNEYAGIFHVKPAYYETSTKHWRPLSEVTFHHGNRHIILNENWWKIHPRYLRWLDKRCKLIGGQLLIPSTLKSYPTPYTGIVRSLHESLVPLKIGLTTDDFYPDPDPETTTIDGTIWEETSTATWSTIVTQATGDSIDDSGGTLRLWAYWADGSNYRQIGRSMVLFDTSTIGAGSSVTSAVLSSYSIDVINPASKSITVGVYTCSPASNTSLSTADYDQFGTTNQMDSALAYGSVNVGSYEDWTLNATGRGNVSLTGVSKFAWRDASFDVANSAPGTTSNDSYSRPYSSERALLTEDPKLVAIWTTGGGTVSPLSNLCLMGVG